MPQALPTTTVTCVPHPAPPVPPPSVQGDSGFVIFRGKQVIARSKPLQHYFDCPLQFGAHPEYVDATDTAEQADLYQVAVQPGDIVVAGASRLTGLEAEGKDAWGRAGMRNSRMGEKDWGTGGATAWGGGCGCAASGKKEAFSEQHHGKSLSKITAAASICLFFQSCNRWLVASAGCVLLFEPCPTLLVRGTGSDGLWDNGFDEEILRIVRGADSVQDAANALAAVAREHASDPEYASPYVKEALSQG